MQTKIWYGVDKGLIFTIDRIQRLCAHYRVPMQHSQLHELFNVLDDQAGIYTTWMPGHDGCCFSRRCSDTGGVGFISICKCRRYIGARLALHEELLARNIHSKFEVRMKKFLKPIPHLYFWLGADAV